jgi:hypothetical protein
VWTACLGAATNQRAMGRTPDGGGEKRKDEDLALTRAFAAFAGLAFSFNEQFNLLQFAVCEVVSTNSVNALPLLHTLGHSMQRSTFTRYVSGMAGMAKQAFAMLYRAIPLLERFTYLIGDNLDKVYVCCSAWPYHEGHAKLTRHLAALSVTFAGSKSLPGSVALRASATVSSSLVSWSNAVATTKNSTRTCATKRIQSGRNGLT